MSEAIQMASAAAPDDGFDVLDSGLHTLAVVVSLDVVTELQG